MEAFDLYKDMRVRTNGEIYIGVVGPVRSGKSTFIKQFMEELVLPEMTESVEYTRTVDELPQSASGKTIMTTEPKFVPKEAAKLLLSDGTDVKIRLIDCVGYMAEGATGHMEGDTDRMVKTPWSDEEIPFSKAAEIGTGRVITEHSTVGVLMTSDGSFGELKRESFLSPEEKTVSELKRLGKPFVVLLNSANPAALETTKLSSDLAQKYDVTVLPVNAKKLQKAELYEILTELLAAFPITKTEFLLPKWAELLPEEDEIKTEALSLAKELLKNRFRIQDVRTISELPSSEVFQPLKNPVIHMDSGVVEYVLSPKTEVYFDRLSQLIGCPVTGEYAFFRTLKKFAETRSKVEKFSNAYAEVAEKGYGVVLPEQKQILLSEPELIHQSGKFGVKIRATAPSIHMIQADIVTELAPIVGSEEQAKDLIAYMSSGSGDGEEDPIKKASIFGKSVNTLVEEGIQTKINNITTECQNKLQESIEKIINDSNGGIICFII